MIGAVLNNTYRVVELVGEGGMAEVYRAVQLTPPQRTVAVKMLKSEYENDAAFVRRFETEAEAVLALNHEHIVHSYDIGEDQGRHYIVLEFVEGRTLKDRIREQGRMQTKQVVALGAQILDALSHAHEMGIIHRDVKPQNIIITNKNRAKLTDFGIARLTASEHTQTFMGGNVLGSVHYLSPEQAKGDQVTVKSDIYSLGVTLYEMATGVLPFDSETSVSVAIKHLSEAVTPPIVHNPTMPPALNDVILRALQKNPLRRYPSARAMKEDLLRVLREPNGTFARPEELITRRARKKKKRGRGILRITLAAFVLIGLFVVLLLTGQGRQQTNGGGGGLVPSLVGKTVEEAADIAKKRGYLLETLETVYSDVYESGMIVTQYPLAGTSLKSGGNIQVSVSGGTVEIIAPALAGLPLAEAEAALHEAQLVRGDIYYELSDTVERGTVIRQDPVEGTPLLPGDEVDLYISGEQNRTIEAPNVSSLSLAEALSVLQNAGFTSFRVYLATAEASSTNNGEGTIIQQSPATGETVSASTRVVLTRNAQALFAAPLSYTIDVSADASTLIAVLLREEEGIAYEQVAFETTLDEGEQELSFTVASDDGGEFTLLLYLNGTQIRETGVILSYRG